MQHRVPILMYHKVARADRRSTLRGHYVEPQLFARQMRALKALGFQSVSLERLFEEPLPSRPVVVTFDDGYRNFLTNALPALEANGFNATVFLVAGQLGGANAWDVALGDVEEPLLTVEEVLRAKSQGVEFGSHSFNHVNLAQADQETAWREVCESKSKLEQILSSPVTTFCYPYGAKNAEVQQMVKNAGYRLACSTEKGANDVNTDRYALRRINIRRDTTMPVFLMKLWRDLRNGK